ncbi:MAG TPA: hypothetical protein DET40_24790 [Lentisphaeria bacterium]|nr:MAG: hypothetical protein A2X45_01215 [Lentisphaerae bacterium GWF2_50_93]HCE46778.1 hypothetical protein [Lentisphaeria bacterium]
MKKTTIYFLLLTMVISCSGCASFSGFEKGQLLSVLTALGTGYIGYKATEGQKHQDLIAGASAVGGYTAAEIIRANIKDESREEFRAGYDLGAGDTVKTQYWIIQNRQREDESRLQADSRYYEFPGTEEKDGVNYAPHKVVIRTEE